MEVKREASKSADRKGIRVGMGEVDSEKRGSSAVCAVLDTELPFAARYQARTYQARTFWIATNEPGTRFFTVILAIEFTSFS